LAILICLLQGFICKIAPQATQEELKSSYRRLCMLYHPDKHRDPELKRQAEELFNLVHQAYEGIPSAALRQAGGGRMGGKTVISDILINNYVVLLYSFLLYNNNICMRITGSNFGSCCVPSAAGVRESTISLSLSW
uniref:J domain-containing protein n=1 Tax=Astyanax mexicanus TaxID=7994 RepID=A0A8B9H012_ASTMX